MFQALVERGDLMVVERRRRMRDVSRRARLRAIERGERLVVAAVGLVALLGQPLQRLFERGHYRIAAVNLRLRRAPLARGPVAPRRR